MTLNEVVVDVVFDRDVCRGEALTVTLHNMGLGCTVAAFTCRAAVTVPAEGTSSTQEQLRVQ